MTIEEYLKRRNNGQSLEEIQTEKTLSEGTVWTLELGYQCCLKNVPLDKAIDLIRRIHIVDPKNSHPSISFNPNENNNEHKNELAEMNDRINDSFVNFTGKKPTKQQIKSISEQLPESIKLLACQWGWNDTEVSEFTYTWIEENLEKI